MVIGPSILRIATATNAFSIGTVASEFYNSIPPEADIVALHPAIANRFARYLVVQETGFLMLRELGYDLIAADSPNSFLEDTPTANLIR